MRASDSPSGSARVAALAPTIASTAKGLGLCPAIAGSASSIVGVFGATGAAGMGRQSLPYRGGAPPQQTTAFLIGPGLSRYGVLILIVVMDLILGCVMDAMTMIILTIPIIFPVVAALGFDPIWFGVIIVMTVEFGLIHPPVGMNVFAIKSVVKDVMISTIFVGVLPFVITDLLRLAVLIAFPVMATSLPSRM